MEVVPAAETSWTATIALVLAVIAIIFIIVVVYLFSVNSTAITSRVDDWILIESGSSGTVGSPESFVATPNTILNISPSATGTYYVAINNYTGISSVLAAGRTTLFKIVNTRSNAAINVVAGSGVTFEPNNPGPNPNIIAPGTTATYMWISPTRVQRID